jgi:hypothetical protein
VAKTEKVDRGRHHRGIRVPSEDALRKIAFNVASASASGRSKKYARQRRTRIPE